MGTLDPDHHGSYITIFLGHSGNTKDGPSAPATCPEQVSRPNNAVASALSSGTPEEIAIFKALVTDACISQTMPEIL